MGKLELIALAGGLYAPLVFWHFIADWLTQTEKAAQTKSKNMKVLTLHCFIYTMAFVPFFYLYDLSMWMRFVAWPVLFLSHMLGDTYLPVFWWAKYIRKMTYNRHYDDKRRIMHPSQLDINEQFLESGMFYKPPMFLVIDQLWHMAFLWIIPILAIIRKIYV